VKTDDNDGIVEVMKKQCPPKNQAATRDILSVNILPNLMQTVNDHGLDWIQVTGVLQKEATDYTHWVKVER
jgi:hypothetical protein